MRSFKIVIRGNDVFEEELYTKQSSFDKAYIAANITIKRFSAQTKEKLRIHTIEEITILVMG